MLFCHYSGKTCWSRSDATIAQKSIIRKHGRARTYKCPQCGYWHLATR